MVGFYMNQVMGNFIEFKLRISIGIKYVKFWKTALKNISSMLQASDLKVGNRNNPQNMEPL